MIVACDIPDSLRDESKYLERVFIKNNYNTDFIRRNTYRPTDADATNQNLTHVTTVTIPYIKVLANEDTLLRTHCSRHNVPRLPARATFVADTNVVSGTQKCF